MAQRLCPVCCPDCSHLINVRKQWNEILGICGAEAIDFDIPFREFGSEDTRQRISLQDMLQVASHESLYEYRSEVKRSLKKAFAGK